MSSVTVAICTYHRGDLLAKTLASLADSDPLPAGLTWELLVVDNGCEDSVKTCVAGFEAKLPVRYLAEPAVGLSRARNRAVNEAAAPVIIFTDDDALMHRQWLARMAGAIHEHPECDFWGGRIEPVWDFQQPRWFDIQRCPMLGDSIIRYDAGHEPRAWDPDKDTPFLGCNMAFGIDAIRRAGMFDVTLGHIGDKLGTGEDSWMILKIAQAGGKGWYVADALVHHPVPPQRVRRSFARGFAWRQGRVSVEMLRRNRAPADAAPRSNAGRVPRWLYRLAAAETLRACAQWLAGLMRLDPAGAFAGQYKALFNFSKLWHAMTTK